MNNLMKLLSTAFVVLFLAGCATGAKMENMTYSGGAEGQITYDEPLKDQVAVESVAGGKKTNPAWTSEIDNVAFEGALKASLESQGLYSESGRYQLSAELLKVDQPMFGLDFTVTTYVKYQLLDTQTDKVVFSKTIAAPYTATVGDAFAGVKRLRLANEGSGKENIRKLLSELSGVDINESGIVLKN